MFLNKPLLSKEQITKLQEHKYTCINDSIADTTGPLRPWWNFVAKFIPSWMAPNLITTLGAISIGIPSILFLYCCPNGTDEVPVGVTLWALFGLFGFQTLDNVDGIQARRTKSSNALGELFDHGLDAISVVWVTLIGVCAVGMGKWPYIMIVVCFLTVTRFAYIACAWQPYATGVVRFYAIDGTDGQVFIMSVLGATALLGLEFWKTILFGSVTFGGFISVVGCCVSLVSCPSIFYKFLNSERKGAFWTPFCPLLFIFTSEICIAVNSETRILENHPVLYTLVFSLMISKIATKLMIAAMCESSMEFFDIIFLLPLMLLLNQLSGMIFPEDKLLWFSLGFICVTLAYYWFRVVSEICQQTGWYIFKINKQK